MRQEAPRPPDPVGWAPLRAFEEGDGGSYAGGEGVTPDVQPMPHVILLSGSPVWFAIGVVVGILVTYLAGHVAWRAWDAQLLRMERAALNKLGANPYARSRILEEVRPSGLSPPDTPHPPGAGSTA